MNPLSKKYNMPSLIMFALPNTVMMLFSSLYIIVDGGFVARMIGTTALSAVNMFYPFICLELAVGIMIATGGSAIIARKLGEGDGHQARQNFTFLVIVVAIAGLLTAVLGILFIDPIITFLGANEVQFALCRTYAVTLLAFAPLFFLQTVFQTFFVTAGKPIIGLVIIVAAGLTNVLLDYVFMGPLGMGIGGAAIATGIGYSIPAVIGVVFFCRRQGELYFVRPRFDSKVLIKALGNGSSEMVTNLANAITTFLFNYTFMQYWGEDGVASITIILYTQYIFTAFHFGYANGVAPVISYKLGGGDKAQVKGIIKNSLLFVSICSVLSLLICQLAAGPILSIFTNPDTAVYAISMSGIRIYAVGFVFMGISIFTSAMFTALSDGKTSAIISFARTFIFLAAMILILPQIMGKTGVWLAVPVAELLGIAVSVLYLSASRLSNLKLLAQT